MTEHWHAEQRQFTEAEWREIAEAWRREHPNIVGFWQTATRAWTQPPTDADVIAYRQANCAHVFARCIAHPLMPPQCVHCGMVQP